MPAPRLVDLHTHTTASDGTDSPRELVRKAASIGLLAVAITDHDTMAGHEEAFEAGYEHNIEVIGGCELSTNHNGHSVHILGLWLPQEQEAHTRYFANLQAIRTTRNERIIEKLQALGINLTHAELMCHTKEKYGDVHSIGRPHIASALCHMGYIATEHEAYERYIGQGKPAYAARKGITPQEAVTYLASIGATTSIAHPMMASFPTEELDDLIADLKAAGMHAIEAYHSSHSEADVRHCVGLAARHGLALSGGSDYHGSAKPHIKLGVGKGGLRVALHILETLKGQRRKLGLPV